MSLTTSLSWRMRASSKRAAPLRSWPIPSRSGPAASSAPSWSADVDAIALVLMGLPMTLLVTVSSFGIGAIVGIPLMLGLRSNYPPIRAVFRVIVDVIRGVPTIVWLFLLFFGVTFGHL